MTKVGIVTFHRAMNYGAVLQTYAFQQKLRNEGLICDVIDQRNDRVDIHYGAHRPKLKRTGNIIRNLKMYLSATLHLSEEKHKREIFDSFLRDNLVLSRQCNSKQELQRISDEYDLFFCGSDQVWNLGSIAHNGAYFLDFTESRKKNSYAASIGTEHIRDVDTDEYRLYLSDFNHISVREKASIGEIRRVANKESVWVLDPTLLLTKDDWAKCSSVCEVPKEYILVYVLYDIDNKKIIDFIERCNKETGLPVVVIGKNKFIKIKDKIELTPTPDQWVWLFKNATTIITNSFHGTLFSINFHKDFYTGLLMPQSRPANIRLRDVLDFFELNNRIISYDEAGDSAKSTIIEWESVDAKLEMMREKSIEYIRTVIKDYNK